MIKDIVGFNGKLVFDIKKPDGMPIKVLDNTIINQLGWKSNFNIKTSLIKTYNWYKKLKI